MGIELIPEIEKLLAADEENIRVIRRVLSDFSSSLPDTINQASVLYSTTLRVFGQGIKDHFSELAKTIKSFGVSEIEQLKDKLAKPRKHDNKEPKDTASIVLNDFYSRENRGMLLAQLGVLYAMAVTDLLRMRVTAAYSYLRIQCEALALAKVMNDTPSVAREWREIQTEEDGLSFYRSYQKRIRSALQSFGLEYHYDHSSATAVHSRFAGIARALSIEAERNGQKFVQLVKVKAQEFDQDQPFFFILSVLFILQSQALLLSHLGRRKS